MRKMVLSGAAVLTVVLVAAVSWPTPRPDVERFGDSVYETIWFWRIPAYAHNSAWSVRWIWNDPLRAQARCCRATPQPISEPGPQVPPANQAIARLAGR
ncbi:hypothetical protein QA649_32720 [Bradyrhizobium sp. CB1717]|uniref:hypothetical protein n=1 Tax=Bradyrhizobium sp. CB1717 TaxID=3039154 RepID=UPI0024B0CB81|nr:hypothetical protein [Bradyrhizobium sp. CB1717]WFU22815.1 hypothetical protein QA649_32720 [Bradyrhizobium sp. CB1717]